MTFSRVIKFALTSNTSGLSENWSRIFLKALPEYIFNAHLDFVYLVISLKSFKKADNGLFNCSK